MLSSSEIRVYVVQWSLIMALCFMVSGFVYSIYGLVLFSPIFLPLLDGMLIRKLRRAKVRPGWYVLNFFGWLIVVWMSAFVAKKHSGSGTFFVLWLISVVIFVALTEWSWKRDFGIWSYYVNPVSLGSFLLVTPLSLQILQQGFSELSRIDALPLLAMAVAGLIYGVTRGALTASRLRMQRVSS